jgi:hypothetical protein
MTATTTNLKTQVQAKITAATSALSLEDLLILRKAADGLDCDESNLDTLITAKLNAMNSSTAPEDLLIGNRAADIPESTGSQTVVKKMQKILASTPWTSPANLAGNVAYVSGCGAGGSGCIVSNMGCGGFGGAFGIKIPYQVAPAEVITVVIGAGGLGPTGSNNPGAAGGSSSFGTLTFSGGAGGKQTNGALHAAFSDSGVRPYIAIGTTEAAYFSTPSESVFGNIAGSTIVTSTNIATGGAAGLFGNGTNAVSGSGANSASAAANSGAGSGAVLRAATHTVGNGGSGAIIVEWEEFV